MATRTTTNKNTLTRHQLVAELVTTNTRTPHQLVVEILKLVARVRLSEWGTNQAPWTTRSGNGFNLSALSMENFREAFKRTPVTPSSGGLCYRAGC